MRYAIISDIHEDVTSLHRALIKIEKEGCDEIVCLGDISGFSVPYYHHYDNRNAHECLRLIKENCKIIVLGNHDLHAAKIIPRMNPLFNFPANWYELDYFGKKKASANKVWLYEENDLTPYYTASDIDYLKTLPQHQTANIKGINVLFSHYLYPNITGTTKHFYHGINDFNEHINFMEKNHANYSFAGHSHSQRCYSVSPKKMRYTRFRNLKLTEEPTVVLAPAVAGNRRNNGFCILDLATMQVKIKYI